MLAQLATVEFGDSDEDQERIRYHVHLQGIRAGLKLAMEVLGGLHDAKISDEQLESHPHLVNPIPEGHFQEVPQQPRF